MIINAGARLLYTSDGVCVCDRLCQVLDCRGRYGVGGVFFFSVWDPSALWAEEDRGFKKDYERNLQNVKFFKKVNKQVKTG